MDSSAKDGAEDRENRHKLGASFARLNAADGHPKVFLPQAATYACYEGDGIRNHGNRHTEFSRRN